MLFHYFSDTPPAPIVLTDLQKTLLQIQHDLAMNRADIVPPFPTEMKNKIKVRNLTIRFCIIIVIILINYEI